MIPATTAMPVMAPLDRPLEVSGGGDEAAAVVFLWPVAGPKGALMVVVIVLTPPGLLLVDPLLVTMGTTFAGWLLSVLGFVGVVVLVVLVLLVVVVVGVVVGVVGVVVLGVELLVPGVGGEGSGLGEGRGTGTSGSVGLVGWLELFGAPPPGGVFVPPVEGGVVAEPVPWPGAGVAGPVPVPGLLVWGLELELEPVVEEGLLAGCWPSALFSGVDGSLEARLLLLAGSAGGGGGVCGRWLFAGSLVGSGRAMVGWAAAARLVLGSEVEGGMRMAAPAWQWPPWDAATAHRGCPSGAVLLMCLHT